MNLYFQRKQSYHISPYLSWKELCFHSGCSQIKAKLNIISHLCFHITIIPSKQNYISKYCTTGSSHSRRQRDKISCWSSVQPKREHEFAKFQVDHSSSGQSIEWRALQFRNVLQYSFLEVCTASGNISPFVGAISCGRWHVKPGHFFVMIFNLLSEIKRL